MADNEQFRSAFREAPIGMVVFSPDNTVLLANPAVCSMLGLVETELVGRQMFPLLHPEDQDDARRRVELMHAGALDGYHVERRLLHPDGDYVWVDLTVSAVRDASGQLTSIVSQMIDVTDRRASEAALLASQSENRALLDAIPDLMFRVDADGVVRWWRPARDFPPAMPPEAFLGKHVSEFHPEMAEVWIDVFGRVMANRGHELVEYEMETEGEMRSYEAQVAAISGEEVLVAIRDITSRVRLQQRLKELVQSKDEFVAAASHELRTPLTSVVGFANEIRDRWEDLSGDEVLDMVKLIADQGREMSELVEDLLVAARGDVGMVAMRPEEIDIVEEIGGVLAVWPQADIAVTSPDEGVRALADPFRFRQMMRNLFVNGFRHGAGSMAVEVHLHGSNAVVVVHNAGPDIPEDDWELVFDPYQPAEPPPTKDGGPPSVGLGLSVARMLAWLMEGDLTFYVEDGQGTFELLLPAG